MLRTSGASAAFLFLRILVDTVRLFGLGLGFAILLVLFLREEGSGFEVGRGGDLGSSWTGRGMSCSLMDERPSPGLGLGSWESDDSVEVWRELDISDRSCIITSFISEGMSRNAFREGVYAELTVSDSAEPIAGVKIVGGTAVAGCSLLSIKTYDVDS